MQVVCLLQTGPLRATLRPHPPAPFCIRIHGCITSHPKSSGLSNKHLSPVCGPRVQSGWFCLRDSDGAADSSRAQPSKVPLGRRGPPSQRASCDGQQEAPDPRGLWKRGALLPVGLSRELLQGPGSLSPSPWGRDPRERASQGLQWHRSHPRRHRPRFLAHSTRLS